MVDAITELAEWWRANGGEPAKASVGEQAIRELEHRYGIALPEDFRAYLLLGAPEDDFWDEGDAIWWAPSRVRNIPDEYEHPISDPAIAADAHTYLFFADYMIWCWAWAICCGEGANRGRVALIGGLPDRFVADSFTEFVQMYVGNPLSVC